ncbi:MAG: MBL fold metallo-hydrolase [Eubacteriales bacterium]|nr:MBL fold metallo-hydrolase [Eubacteriales bacterium]
MKLTMLMENTPYAEGFQAEHGLSLYIETEAHNILFDMGQTDAFVANAEKLHIDLNKVDLAVLSHGHYDHSGGLKAFLGINRHAPVYASEFAFEPHWHGRERNIGIDPELKNHPQMVLVNDQKVIDASLSLCACNGQPRPYPMDPYGLNAEHNGIFGPDRFLHEQYLTIRENGRKVVISGCSHKGVLNIVHWLSPDVLVGGFHFMKVDPAGSEKSVLDEAARVLLSFPTTYYTGHCTGVQQYEYLKKQMGARLHYFASGQRIAL